MTELRVVEEWFASVERADYAAMRERYAPDATIWHCDGTREQSVEENVTMLTAVSSVLSNLRYEVLRRVETTHGVYSQHVLCGDLPDGTEFRLAAAMFLQVENNRIQRVEEYFDSAQVTGLIDALTKDSQSAS